MRFLHTMLRVADPEPTVRFFELLGLEERRRLSGDGIGECESDQNAEHHRDEDPVRERETAEGAALAWGFRVAHSTPSARRGITATIVKRRASFRFPRQRRPLAPP